MPFRLINRPDTFDVADCAPNRSITVAFRAHPLAVTCSWHLGISCRSHRAVSVSKRLHALKLDKPAQSGDSEHAARLQNSSPSSLAQLIPGRILDDSHILSLWNVAIHDLRGASLDLLPLQEL